MQEQINLFGKTIEDHHRLSDNYLKIISIFSNNEYVKFNIDMLSKCLVKSREMSRITIVRFLRDCLDWGYIEEVGTIEVRAIKGNIIRKKLMYEDGKPVVDKRKKYYRITTGGINTWKQNLSKQ